MTERFEYKNRHRLDPEIANLVIALNSFPRIHTTESCCGHGQHSAWICFETESLDSLPPLLYWFRKGIEAHSFHKWAVKVYTNVGMDIVSFRLEGPTGEEGYAQADELAELMMRRNPPNGYTFCGST